MKRKGVIFLDIIIGLFIIGLIVVVSFPILTLTSKGLERSKEMTKKTYMSEATIENLKSKDEISIKFLEDLEKAGELEYPYLEDEKYMVKVKLLDSHPGLWNLSIKTNTKNSEGEKEYVEIKATITK